MPSNQKKLSGTEDDKTGFTFVVTTSASKQTAEDKKKVRSAAALSSWPERRKRIFEQVDERQAGQGKFYLDSPYGASQPSTTRKKARAEHTSSSTAVSQPAGDARDGSLNASFQLAPGVIQPLVRRSEYGSPPTQCTRPTSPKIPCNCPDAFKDWKGYAMSITAEEPPDKHRGASASPYRIDIVVDAYERGGLRRFTLLFLEIKRAAAGPSKCEEVEAQAYRACLMHTSAQTSYVFAMTAIGTSTRTWKYYQGNFVPMNGQSGRSDPQLYIDAADKGKGVALLGQLLQMIDLLGFDLAKKADLPLNPPPNIPSSQGQSAAVAGASTSTQSTSLWGYPAVMTGNAQAEIRYQQQEYHVTWQGQIYRIYVESDWRIFKMDENRNIIYVDGNGRGVKL